MSSGFISETELSEQRKIRQEEWERVRSAEQPLERPEEPYDGRSLFDRLQEQKLKRDTEYEEAHKLKNMIKGLDDDEVEFLDLVDRAKLAEERRKIMEEQKELKEFKAKVASLQEKSLEEKLKQELRQPQTSKTNSSGKSSQLKLLAGAVIRKSSKSENSSSVETQCTKRKHSETSQSPNSSPNTSTKNEKETKSSPCSNENVITIIPASFDEGALKCVGFLPGLGTYENSTSSDSSASDEDDEPKYKQPKRDMLGRLIIQKEETEEKSAGR